MEELSINPESDECQDNLSLVRYLYLNKTRCRFNIYGLKKSDAMSKYLMDKFLFIEGVKTIKPSLVTGNVLVEFDPHKIHHKQIFSRLQAEVGNFLSTGPILTSKMIIPLSAFSRDRMPSPTRSSISQQGLYKIRRNCTFCLRSLHKRNNSPFVLNTYIFDILFKTAIGLIFKGITMRIIGKAFSI